jgi:tetratricopeptide (TPR) repeat protein
MLSSATMFPRARTLLLAGLLLAAATAAAYAPVARNAFVSLDDGAFIYRNPQVLSGLSWDTARWALTAIEYANWYPLTRLAHLADASLFGMWAGGHHLVNVAWHAAAAALLGAALLLLTGAAGRSLLVAALFALHPLQVESVAWAAERSMVLAGFFFAATLLLWARYVRRPGVGRYVAALAAYALGLASKPVLVSLPLLLVLLDLWPLGRLAAPGAPPWLPAAGQVRRRLLEKVPFLLLAAAGSAMTLFSQRAGIASFESLPFGARAANAAVSLWRYVGKLLFPVDLAVLYPYASVGAATAAAALLALAAATLLLLAAFRRRPWLGVGWLWFLVTLSPMLGLVQVGAQAMADRYAYLSLAGFALALAWELGERLPRRGHRAWLRPLGALALLGALGGATAVQASLWRDSETLFRHALAAVPRNPFVEVVLARALAGEGRHEEAVGHYLAALQLKEDFPQARYDLGISYFRLGRFEDSIAQLSAAVRQRPDFVAAYNNLGPPLAALGRQQEAVLAYRAALRLQPGNALAHRNLAIALTALGSREEALAEYRAALRLQPGDAEAALNVGDALYELRRHDEAAASYREALRLRPDYAAAHHNLGAMLVLLGRYEEAAAQYREALRLQPGNAITRANLEALLGRMGAAGPGRASSGGGGGR